jgi:antitoxin ParD1/3/4
MDPAEKLSITLPPSLARLVREKVDSGAYASNSEFIREALRAWQEREVEREQRLMRIRADIEEAMNDPRPSIPAEQVFDDLRALHRETLKTRERTSVRLHGS